VPSEAWNQVIAYLTQGLLYGREVERPQWFTKDRKRPYKPHANDRPAIRRTQVRELLLKGSSRADIAAELGMSIDSLMQHSNKIFKSERVRGQRALLIKYNRAFPPRLILSHTKILDQHRTGLSQSEIASKLKVNKQTVQHYLCALRRCGQLPPHRTKRTAVAELHAGGYSTTQIAKLLNMSPQSVSTRLSELRRAGLLPPVRGRRRFQA